MHIINHANHAGQELFAILGDGDALPISAYCAEVAYGGGKMQAKVFQPIQGLDAGGWRHVSLLDETGGLLFYGKIDMVKCSAYDKHTLCIYATAAGPGGGGSCQR